jgi:hypothetical protein
MGALVDALQTKSSILCWSWLASTLSTDGRIARFDGARIVEIDLTAEVGLGDTAGTLELWNWAFDTDGLERVDAVQRAVSLAVYKSADLGLALRILKTSKWLFDLSRRSLLAEALSARRSLRESALGIARATSDSAAAIAGKATDRAIAECAVALGIIVAASSAKLDPITAGRLLLAVAGLVLVTGVTPLVSDLPAAKATLRTFEEDLMHFREAMSDDDIAEVKAMSSLRVVSRRLCWQTWAMAISTGVIVLALLAIAWRIAADFSSLF